MSETVECKDGVRFKLMGRHDLIGKFLRRDGDYEPELKQLARMFVRAKHGRILDVGANIGTFSIPLAREHPHLRFVGFEAQSRVYVRLLENLSVNGISNVRAVHCGISDEPGLMKCSIPDYENEGNVGAFSLDGEVREHEYEIQTDGGEEEFTLRTLDSYGYSDVILMKIDVEGMEEKVLRGAYATLRDSYWPPILFEAWTFKEFYQPRRESLLSYLASIGYEVTQVGQNNAAQHVSRADRFAISVQSDVVQRLEP